MARRTPNVQGPVAGRSSAKSPVGRTTEAASVNRLRRRGRKRAAKNPSPPVHLYIGNDFAVRLYHNFRFQRHVTNNDERGLIWTRFQSFKAMQAMALSDGGQRLRSVPNAGGNSVDSEVLSFEVLHRCFGASLLKTEMEIAYYPMGGSITDYTCLMFGTRLGVSVTRAMRYHGTFESEDAEKLLQKKLKGIINANRNSLESWSKQLLHVWAFNASVADQIARTYSQMPLALTKNTVVLVTIATTDLDRSAIF